MKYSSSAKLVVTASAGVSCMVASLSTLDLERDELVFWNEITSFSGRLLDISNLLLLN